MSFFIEKLTIKHIEEILHINYETAASSWNKSDFEAEINNENSINLGVIDGESGAVKSFLIARPIMIEENNTQIDVLILATSLNNQREGLAKLLLRYLVISQTSSVELILEVREKNRNALTFYQKFGFKIIHQRKKYYHTPQDNALILQLKYFG